MQQKLIYQSTAATVEDFGTFKDYTHINQSFWITDKYTEGNGTAEHIVENVDGSFQNEKIALDCDEH
jgi:hypothetical protein